MIFMNYHPIDPFLRAPRLTVEEELQNRIEELKFLVVVYRFLFSVAVLTFLAACAFCMYLRFQLDEALEILDRDIPGLADTPPAASALPLPSYIDLLQSDQVRPPPRFPSRPQSLPPPYASSPPPLSAHDLENELEEEPSFSNTYDFQMAMTVSTLSSSVEVEEEAHNDDDAGEEENRP